MPEKAKRKRTKKERAQLLRRVLLGLGIAIVAAGVAVMLYNAATSADTTPSAAAIADTTPHGVYCGTECFLINKNGVALKKTSRPSGNLLLVIENEHRTDLAIGTKAVDPAIVAELIFLRETLAEDLGIRLGRATQSRFNTEDFDIVTSEGWDVRISTANNAYATAQILARTLNKLGREAAQLEYIDLRIENRVYYKTL